MNRRDSMFGLSMLFVLGCSPAPAPVSRSMRDPSNPQAPEGATPMSASRVAAAPRPESSDPHAGHEHAGHAAPASSTPAPAAAPAAGAEDGGAAVTYVCPMHPEVTSDKPGLCPKCNMKLVPKK